MKVLILPSKHRQTEISSDSDASDDDIEAIPVNTSFRCFTDADKTQRQKKESTTDDFFTIDTGAGLEVESDKEGNTKKPNRSQPQTSKRKGNKARKEGKKADDDLTVCDEDMEVEFAGEKTGTVTTKKTGKKSKDSQQKIQVSMRGQLDSLKPKKKAKPTSEADIKLQKEVKKVLAKAVVGPGFEQSLGGTAGLRTKKGAKRERKIEKEKTAGTGWFGLPATEITEETRADLELIRMRSALDPTRHYRKNDRSGLPKYFQIGRVVDDPRDFYGGRLTKKERKRTMLDEVMADDEAVGRSKRKFEEIREVERNAIKGSFQNENFKRKRKRSKK